MIRLTGYGLTPKQLGFNLDQWRAGQLEAAERILNSDKRIIVLSAPTGSGKSVINQIPARVSGSRQVILTRTKALQNQYERDDVFALYGRSNYLCNIMPVKSAEYGKCRAGHPCSLMNGGCDYFDAKRTAVNTQQSVLNYSYFFLEANGPGEFSELDYLICDEGHAVPDEISHSYTIKISDYEIRRFKLHTPVYRTVEHWIDWALSVYERFFKQAHTYKRADTVAAAISLMRRIDQISTLTNPTSYICENIKSGSIIRPIWPDHLANKLLWRHSKKFVFSSATIDPWYTMDLLGKPISEVDFIAMPSNFPVENRPVNVHAKHKVRHDMSKEELHNLILDIDRILDKYPNQKGLVHTSNYALAENIFDLSYHKGRIITHQSSNRAQALQEFKESQDPLVLISPSMAEGIDLPYELCEFQIIAKIPFPNLADPVWKARFSQDRNRAERTYKSQTINTIVQACGRGTRAMDDSSDTWILDNNFLWLYRQNMIHFPRFFRDAIQFDVEI